MKKKYLKILLVLMVLLASIGCDQSTKYIIKKHFEKNRTVHVFRDFILLRYVENDGAFLSVFSSFPQGFKIIFLMIVPVLLMLFGIAYLFVNRNVSALLQFSISCIIGGGMGNMIDRVLNNGYVIDFMNIGIGPVRSGIFNCADLSIMLGAVLFILAFKKEAAARAR